MAEGEDFNDPLVLEHMMGFNGDCKGSVQFHPADPHVMISYTGCLVVIADVTNPHEQEFLRGHNEAITCLAVSPTGNLIASGQTSTTRVPNSEATVIVWDYKTRTPVFRLMELHDGIQFSRNKVRQLAFSPDEKFLAGSDDQANGPKMAIWNTATAQLAALHKGAAEKDALAFITWGDIAASERKTQKHPKYTILGATRERVHRFNFEFDVYTMQYKIHNDIMQLPSTGLSRTYHCAAFSKFLAAGKDVPMSYLVAGTSTGELAVFNVDDMVFRAGVPLQCGGGLLSLEVLPQTRDSLPLAYCGCGDGTIKILQGGDLEWVCLAETKLDGPVYSVKVSADGREVLAGTANGNIYRLDAQYLDNLDSKGEASTKPLLASHAKPIGCVSFGDSSEWFVTSSVSGTMRRWELSGYSVDFEIAPPVKTTDTFQKPCAMSLCVKRQQILSGWSDGVIRSYDDESGTFLWEIVSAHRGGVTCIDLTPLYLVSGGIDGSVRVWSDGASRQLVGNFDEHKKAVTGICVDLVKPSLIHSCGADKAIVTVDLDQARRVGCHTVKEGALTSMSQAATHEQELITGDTAGGLKWWDCDEAEPVHTTVTWHPQDDPTKERRITHIEVSPPMKGSRGSDFMVACTASGDLQVWELATGGKPQARIVSVGAAHSDEVTMARWSPDGKQIVSTGKDACICVWNFFTD